MSSQPELAEIKRQVFTAINKISGVAGVGIPAQGLTIYLETESPEVRAAVERALAPLNVPVPIHWQVTGKFQPR
jgi:hypothetical protein